MDQAIEFLNSRPLSPLISSCVPLDLSSYIRVPWGFFIFCYALEFSR